MFAHGFGCDQNMWRFVAPAFESDFSTVLFDHVGAGRSDLTAYYPKKYSTLSGYADDVVEIGRALGLKDAVFVGHSVSAMIGVLAAIKDPSLFESLVLVGPSARYIDDANYVGGFSAKLTNSFCRTDPAIAREFARVTFLSDNRADLPKVKARTLILQCTEDIIAGMQVGDFVQRNIPGSKMVVLRATGHCPNLSSPDEVVAAIREFV
jgi:sigma-B regulation protein RsbQ